MGVIYLDNSATTRVSELARLRMLDALEHYGNPSSLHSEGMSARAILNGSREALLAALGVRGGANAPFKIIFTSCGTESNNLALRGVVNAKEHKVKPKMITTDSEHPSVLEPLSDMERAGKIDVVRLSTKGGVIDEGELKAAVDERTLLVSIMLVNNETGAIYDVERLFSLARSIKPDVITHSDMTQGFLKVIPGRIYASKNTDMITVSGHKIHAPKGIAALAVRSELFRSKRIAPIVFGGGQEDGFRSGTENMPGIAALHGAVEEGFDRLRSGFEDQMSALRDGFCAALPGEITVNRPPRCAPHIISLTLPGIKSQTMLSFLSQKGICVSAGSACSSHGNHGSYVLAAYGLTPKQADCTVRVSLSAFTAAGELSLAAEALAEGVAKLIRF